MREYQFTGDNYDEIRDLVGADRYHQHGIYAQVLCDLWENVRVGQWVVVDGDNVRLISPELRPSCHFT